ncbi:MAG: hypothetical protein HY074_11610 [Deltaproteobacteria bacterium]|nr:hypothetical protein [Deltaproteobacteria bacterium]
MKTIRGMLIVLGLILTISAAQAGAGIFGLSCASVTCSVNYVPATQSASSISITGNGLTRWVGTPMVIALRQGTGGVTNYGANLQIDGTLSSVLDVNALQPGAYTFTVSPSNAPMTYVGNGQFNVVGAAGGPPSPSGSVVGTWISMGMLVPTPLKINPDGTYQFGNNSGNYQPTATGAVFSGMFAGMNGGQGVLANGTLQFKPPGTGATNWAYTFRRQ